MEVHSESVRSVADSGFVVKEIDYTKHGIARIILVSS